MSAMTCIVLKTGGAVVNGQAEVRIVGSGDPVWKLRRARGQKQADQQTDHSQIGIVPKNP